MSKVSKIREIKPIKALRGDPLSIDLGTTFTGTVTAWMKKNPNDNTYREFTIVGGRYLTMTSAETSDFYSGETLVESVEGKWYYDVEWLSTIDGAVSKTIYTGSILFYNDITNSSGVQATPFDEVNVTPFTIEINEQAHGFNVGDAIRINGTTSTYELAFADLEANAGALGLVQLVIDDDNFIYQFGGIYTAMSYVEGFSYFLSPEVAGEILISPTYTTGQYEQFVGTGVKEGLLLNIDFGKTISDDVASGTGLEAIDEGNGIGYRPVGRNPALFGNIGLGAFDFSKSYGASSTIGATGEQSVNFSEDGEASGYGSFIGTGYLNKATGTYVNVVGYDNQSNGYSSAMFGSFNRELTNIGYNFTLGQGNSVSGIAGMTSGVALINGQGVSATVLGAANVDITSSNSGTDTDAPMIIVGNGTHTTGSGVAWEAITRSNLFVGYRDGRLLAPSTTNAVIDADTTGEQLITKAYGDANYLGSGGLEAVLNNDGRAESNDGNSYWDWVIDDEDSYMDFQMSDDLGNYSGSYVDRYSNSFYSGTNTSSSTVTVSEGSLKLIRIVDGDKRITIDVEDPTTVGNARIHFPALSPGHHTVAMVKDILEYPQISLSDLTTDIVIGSLKGVYYPPFQATIVGAVLNLVEAGSGNGMTVDILKDGTSILSTKLTTDTGEKSSTTASIPYVASDSELPYNSQISFDITQVPTSSKGATITLTIRRA